MKFGPLERCYYEPALLASRTLRLWRRAAPYCGDLANMTWLDKVYWLHKAAYPTRLPQAGSDLERHFEKQASSALQLPDGFHPEASATLSAVGDLSPHAFLLRSRQTLYSEVADELFGVDVAMANLECTLSASSSARVEYDTRSGPDFSFDAPTFDVVKGPSGSQFDFVATACNHSLDRGAAGVDETIDRLRAAGIHHHGTNRVEEDADCAALVERNGIRIGILSWSFGLNGRSPPPDRAHIVNVADLNGRVDSVDLRHFERQLEHCRASGTDFVLAHLHWGMEHELYPTPNQVSMAHHLAELGADAIIGHHPHVIQPRELYRTRRDPHRVVPIYYSLGNLINPFTAPWLCAGWIARLDLALGKLPNGRRRVYVAQAASINVVQEADEARGTLALRRVGAAF